jgi:hypothetical protein
MNIDSRVAQEPQPGLKKMRNDTDLASVRHRGFVDETRGTRSRPAASRSPCLPTPAKCDRPESAKNQTYEQGPCWPQNCVDNASMSDFNLLTISAVQSHIGPVIATYLGANRFAEVKPLHWVDSKDAPVRRVFAYAQLKGGVIAPRWGYSFDFVPHLVAGKMQWHRTEKSAIFDAFIDGQSEELNLSYMWGEGGLLEGMTPAFKRRATSAGLLAVGQASDLDIRPGCRAEQPPGGRHVHTVACGNRVLPCPFRAPRRCASCDGGLY